LFIQDRRVFISRKYLPDDLVELLKEPSAMQVEDRVKVFDHLYALQREARQKDNKRDMLTFEIGSYVNGDNEIVAREPRSLVEDEEDLDYEKFDVSVFRKKESSAGRKKAQPSRNKAKRAKQSIASGDDGEASNTDSPGGKTRANKKKKKMQKMREQAANDIPPPQSEDDLDEAPVSRVTFKSLTKKPAVSFRLPPSTPPPARLSFRFGNQPLYRLTQQDSEDEYVGVKVEDEDRDEDDDGDEEYEGDENEEYEGDDDDEDEGDDDDDEGDEGDEEEEELKSSGGEDIERVEDVKGKGRRRGVLGGGDAGDSKSHGTQSDSDDDGSGAWEAEQVQTPKAWLQKQRAKLASESPSKPSRKRKDRKWSSHSALTGSDTLLQLLYPMCPCPTSTA
jgi:hypothetical protein